MQLPGELRGVGARPPARRARPPRAACSVEQLHPHAHRLGDQVADRAGAVVELRGGLHEHAAAREGVAVRCSPPRPSSSASRRSTPFLAAERGGDRLVGEHAPGGAQRWRAAAPPWSRSARTARSCSSRARWPGGRSRGPPGPRRTPAAWPGRGWPAGWSLRARGGRRFDGSSCEIKYTTVRSYATIRPTVRSLSSPMAALPTLPSPSPAPPRPRPRPRRRRPRRRAARRG